jgi:hypothetical protein
MTDPHPVAANVPSNVQSGGMEYWSDGVMGVSVGWRPCFLLLSRSGRVAVMGSILGQYAEVVVTMDGSRWELKDLEFLRQMESSNRSTREPSSRKPRILSSM